MDCWHIEADYIALFIFFIMIIKNCRAKNRNSGIQERAFSVVLTLSIISVTVEIVAANLMNISSAIWLTNLSVAAYIIALPLLCLVWFCYTILLLKKNSGWTHKLVYLSAIPYIVYIVIAITNHFSSLSNNTIDDLKCLKQPLFIYAAIGTALFYSFLGIIIVAINQKFIAPKTNIVLLILFFFISATAVSVQVFASGILIINASYIIIYSLCDMTIEEQHRNELYNKIRQQNSRMEEAVKNAEIANRAKSDFLSRMSHDMRTPMNGILGLTALMKDKNDIDDIKNDLEQISLSGEYLLNLINDTLDMSKIESGKLELRPKPTNSEKLFGNIISNSKIMADDKGVNLEIDVSGMTSNHWIPVVADSSRLEQIFMNLISNAIKYTPSGQTVELIMQTVNVTADTVTDRYIIRDNGIGMSEEFLPHLFEPFSQEGRINVQRQQGTGLGMSIVSELLQLMGGEIAVKSKLNEGTEVSLILTYPIYNGTKDEIETKKISLEVLNGKRVLLCEDHPLNAHITTQLLLKKGVNVEHAENGLIGLEMFQRSANGYYSAVIMDIRMPIMDGLEATRLIRESSNNDSTSIPIIAMTANAFDEDVENCLNVGMNVHLAKPIDPQKLFETLAEIM